MKEKIQFCVLMAFSNVFELFKNGGGAFAVAKNNSQIFNSLIGSKLVSDLMHELHNIFPGTQLHVKSVDDLGRATSGEWLLDGVLSVITKLKDSMVNSSQAFIPQELILALESELNTTLSNYGEDMAKVLHVNAQYKIFLGGLSQKTASGIHAFIDRRLQTTANLLQTKNIDNLFVGFWPAPKIWTSYEESQLLNFIRLFEWTNSGFFEIK